MDSERAAEVRRVADLYRDKANWPDDRVIGVALGDVFALLDARDRAEGKCHWWEDAHNYEDCAWETSCGEMFLFTSDGPKENRMGYCCYCGRRLVAEEYEVDIAGPEKETE